MGYFIAKWFVWCGALYMYMTCFYSFIALLYKHTHTRALSHLCVYRHAYICPSQRYDNVVPINKMELLYFMFCAQQVVV